MNKSIYIKFILFFSFLMVSSQNFATENPNKKFYQIDMKKLIQLTKQNPKYPFAAMIIDNNTGKILCEGVNSANINPTYHGEMVAINNCAKKYSKMDWAHSTLITTAEPCSMCSSAIVWAGIARLVFGTSVQYLLDHGWDQINIAADYVFKKSTFYKGTIIGGVLHEETDKLFTIPPRHSM